jgi:hypothetical protein
MPSKYRSFDVLNPQPDGTAVYYPNASVRIYKAADDTLLATVQSDARGAVMPGTLNVPGGTPIYYEVTVAGSDYQGRQVTETESFVAGANPDGLSHNIIVNADPHVAYYQEATVNPIAGQIYYREEGAADWTLHGTFNPGSRVQIPAVGSRDKTLEVSAVPVGPDGTVGVSSPRDGSRHTFQQQRENTAPTVVQIGASEQGKIDLQITGFTQYARARRVRIADDAAMTTNLTTDIVEYGVGLIPLVYSLMRPTSSGQAAQTVYVRVSHSSTGDGGPWSPESAAQAFTFAADGGSGGSSGGGSYYYGGGYEL